VCFCLCLCDHSQNSMLSVATKHGQHIIFAEAWAPPSYYHSTTRSMTPTKTWALEKHKRSRITRWYVHDDDTKIANGEAITSSPPQQNNMIPRKEHKQQSSIGFNSETKLDLRVLLIDNHDSYTYNLYQYISTMTVHPVKVIMNDAYTSWDSFMASLGPNATASDLGHDFDCIILSPGPGQPSHSSDMGIVLETIRRNAQIPILGVCLGHQALGYVYGNEVKRSPCGPVHGLISTVFHNESCNSDQSEQDLSCQLFRDLPQEFDVVRYHSLVVNFPESCYNDAEIEPIAWCNGLKEISAQSAIQSDANICMALRHKKFPHYGVQFHPESVGTGKAGYQILRNFCDFAHEFKLRRCSNVFGHPSMQMNDHAAMQEETVLDGGGYMESVSRGLNDFQNVNNEDPSSSAYRVLIHKVSSEGHDSSLPLPKQVFEALYSSLPNSFWLDSSTSETHFSKDDTPGHGMNDNEGCPISSNSRFSIMGSNDGPLSRKIEYFGREHAPNQRGLRVISKAGQEEEELMLDEDILSYLRQKMVAQRECTDKVDMVTFDKGFGQNSAVDAEYILSTIDEFDHAGDQLSFDYRGGYVGYLGYEVRHDTQCWIFEQEGGLGCSSSSHDSELKAKATSDATNPNIPTAAFLFVDRSLLYDHQTSDWYIIGVTENEVDSGAGPSSGTNIGDAISWMHTVESKIKSMSPSMPSDDMDSTVEPNSKPDDVVFVPSRSKAQYQIDISRSHEEIRNGESYELCVTNQLEAELQLPKLSTKEKHESPFGLYKLLRKKNPAPFSAFMNFYNEEGSRRQMASASLSICCSSPERFLSVKKAQVTSKVNEANYMDPPLSKRQFVVESKPIKGTAARYLGSDNGADAPDEDQVKSIDSQIAARLKESVKDRAENLMIVDLLRNDLGRVCQVGSVHVPKLMHIESYATVHQMVSTVRGMLDGDKMHAIDLIEACFPGGSMTGAPKQRTMEILDEIEQGVSRGPYSGCLGYISLNGCMDMNIVIRSAVLTPSDNPQNNTETWRASIGCGGAITALSDSDDEYEEMLLKSRVVRKTISDWAALKRTAVVSVGRLQK